MSALIDTDVLIDLLRGLPAAKSWLERWEGPALEVPGIVAMELVAGCRDQVELQRVQRFVQRFSLTWPDAPEFEQAHALFVANRLTSGLGIPDCLIAAMAISRSATLYTFNLRHFRLIPGVDAEAPYERS